MCKIYFWKSRCFRVPGKITEDLQIDWVAAFLDDQLVTLKITNESLIAKQSTGIVSYRALRGPAIFPKFLTFQNFKLFILLIDFYLYIFHIISESTAEKLEYHCSLNHKPLDQGDLNYLRYFLQPTQIFFLNYYSGRFNGSTGELPDFCWDQGTPPRLQ